MLKRPMRLENLGYVAERQKRFADSEAIHRRVLKIRETLFGPEHSDIAYSYDSLGTLYEAMHEFSKAESMYRRSLEIREQTLDENDPLIAHSLGALGWIQVELGDYMQAERELQRALRIRETVEENHPDTAVVLANLGTVYSSIGEYSGAETFYRRAEKVSTAVYGKDHIETVHARHGLGNVYGDIGEYAQAESLLKNALEVTERELGPDNESTGNILTSLGWLYERKGDFTAAEPYYRRAYEVTLRTVGEDHPTTALARLNLSINHRETGDYAKAEELLQQALTGFRTTYGPDHFNVGESLRYLGLLYLTSGDYVRAEETLGQSLSIFQRTLTDSHPFVATVQQLLSVTHAALGDFRKATQFREQSRRSVRRHMAKTLPGLSQKSQQKYLAANFRPDFVAALSLGLHQKDDPRTATLSAGWLLNGKGVAQEVLAEAALLSTAEAVPLVRRLRQVRDEISKLAIQRTGQDESKRREALAILETEQQRLQQQIGEHGLGLNKADPWVSASSVRGQLPFDSVFVNIARFDVAQVTSLKKDREPARYVAWVIPAAGAGEIHLVDLGPAQPIDQKVAAIRAQIQKTLNDLPESDEAALETALQKSLNEISDLVLRPLEASLGDVVEVILSPDGSLWNLPWNALLMSDGRYLVEAFRTRYVLSGRELVASIPERAAISEPVLFADPDFDLSPDGVQAAQSENRHHLRFASTARFQRLSASAAEAVAIKPSVEAYSRINARVLLQKDAQEAAFKNLHRPRVLLLSTHGFFQKDPATASEGAEASTFGNPLLRCGLALSGCNNRAKAIEEETEDGILTGLEIVGTDLRGTELVVLSACETGLGDIHSGEGVAGLRQAFQLAGAQSVVSSLWQVEDGETARLMSDLFRNIADGMNKSEALRQAQLTRIQKRRERFGSAHPFFWAAFTLTGQQ
ncbi:MAG: CHAT domain-containing tetratricopeptide repeat protein [Planctomycetaceae bacterium]